MDSEESENNWPPLKAFLLVQNNVISPFWKTHITLNISFFWHLSPYILSFHCWLKYYLSFLHYFYLMLLQIAIILVLHIWNPFCNLDKTKIQVFPFWVVSYSNPTTKNNSSSKSLIETLKKHRGFKYMIYNTIKKYKNPSSLQSFSIKLCSYSRSSLYTTPCPL